MILQTILPKRSSGDHNVAHACQHTTFCQLHAFPLSAASQFFHVHADKLALQCCMFSGG